MDSEWTWGDENRTQIDRQDFVEIFHACFCDRRELADTYVVDYNIDISPFFQNMLHTTFKCIFITDIDRIECSSAILSYLLSCYFVNITESDLMPGLAERCYDSLADTFSSACNEHPSFQAVRLWSNYSRLFWFYLVSWWRFLFTIFLRLFPSCFSRLVLLLLSFYIIVCHEFFIFKSEEQK